MDMEAFIVEEVPDEGGVSLKLSRVSRRLKDNNGPLIGVEELGSTEDVETVAAMMDGGLHNVSSRWQVGIGIAWIVCHGEEGRCVVMGGGSRGGRRQRAGGSRRCRWNDEASIRGLIGCRLRRFAFNAVN
jgi:hypothetical protein